MTDENIDRFRVMNHDDYELDYIADRHHNFKKLDLYDCCDLLNKLNWLADGNEEQLLKVMSYLHDNYYDIWEEVNKECFE